MVPRIGGALGPAATAVCPVLAVDCTECQGIRDYSRPIRSCGRYVGRSGRFRARPGAAGPVAHSESLRAETNASWGTSTRPMFFIRFLPSFWRSRSLRLRVMSPP